MDDLLVTIHDTPQEELLALKKFMSQCANGTFIRTLLSDRMLQLAELFWTSNSDLDLVQMWMDAQAIAVTAQQELRDLKNRE